MMERQVIGGQPATVGYFQSGMKPGTRDDHTLVKVAYDNGVVHFLMPQQPTHDLFDPNEARDPSGKWTSSGGVSEKPKTEPKRETVSFVSPNADPGQLSFSQAQEGLKSPRQKLLAGISHKIDSDLGIKDVRVNHVIGAWSDGAENSVMTNSASTDPDVEMVSAVMKGYLANQKAVLLFHPVDDNSGHQLLAHFRTSGKLADIHDALLKAGVAFHTLEPRGDDTIVHFYTDSEEELQNFADVAKKYNAEVNVHSGHGQFIPAQTKEDGTDAEQRAFSRQAYEQAIERVEAAGKLPSGFRSVWENHKHNWERETGEPTGGGERSESAPAAAPEPAGEPEREPDRPAQRGRTQSLEQAQRSAEAAADGQSPLEGLPTEPIYIDGDHYIPGPVAKIRDVAENYMKSAGLPYDPPKAYREVDVDRGKRIADAFVEMKHDPTDPKVKKSYEALAKETIAQWQAVKATGLEVEWIKPDQPDPYLNSLRKAAIDVQRNNHWWGLPTDIGFGSEAEANSKENPLLQLTDEVIDGKRCTVNDLFRIVHDYFGHFKEGNGFSPSGEENAWRLHSSMYSKEALPAVTSETRGQNSWLNYGPHGETNRVAPLFEAIYAPEKCGLLPEWTYNEGREDTDKSDTKPTSVKVRQDNGDLSEVKLPQEVISQARTLKEAPDRYFKTETEGTEMVPVEKLVQTRARPEGIAHAVKLMEAAYQGEGGKRGPIHVQKLDDGHYLVLDGNSTTTIATAAGWEHLPAIVIPDASYLPKKEKKTGDRRWNFLHIYTLDRLFKIRLRDKEFVESEHPRGQPENAGEFVSGGGTAASTTKTPAKSAAPTKRATKAVPALKLSQGHPGMISTAQPKGKQDEFHQPNLEQMESDPKRFADNIKVFHNKYGYPLQEVELKGTDHEVARHIIDHIKDNLEFIYNNTPEEERNHTKEWYKGARKLVDQHIEKYKQYGLKDTAVAGIYAALSPNNLWDQNVRQGDQMIDIYYNHRKDPWDKAMDEVADNYPTENVKKAMMKIKGKTYDAIPQDKPVLRGLWILTHDLAHNKTGEWNGEKLDFQPFHRVTPEGERHEWFLNPKSKGPGSERPRAFAWQSMEIMAKAVRILEADGDPQVVSDAVGSMHKTRSFYNNILDPDSTNHDVTIDTHAVNAAWLMNSKIAVAHNFKNVPMISKRPEGWQTGASASIKSGTKGTYPFYEQAYQEAAEELHVQPRELQSVVWETKRRWMGDQMDPANLKRIKEVWDEYMKSNIDQHQAQIKAKKIIDEDIKARAG